MFQQMCVAVETPVKYFARVENQQKWREKYKNQDKNNSDGKWKAGAPHLNNAQWHQPIGHLKCLIQSHHQHCISLSLVGEIMTQTEV